MDFYTYYIIYSFLRVLLQVVPFLRDARKLFRIGFILIDLESRQKFSRETKKCS